MKSEMDEKAQFHLAGELKRTRLFVQPTSSSLTSPNGASLNPLTTQSFPIHSGQYGGPFQRFNFQEQQNKSQRSDLDGESGSSESLEVLPFVASLSFLPPDLSLPSFACNPNPFHPHHPLHPLLSSSTMSPMDRSQDDASYSVMGSASRKVNRSQPSPPPPPPPRQLTPTSSSTPEKGRTMMKRMDYESYMSEEGLGRYPSPLKDLAQK